MIKIFDSNVKITNMKLVTPKMMVGTVYSTHKVDDNFIKTFVECKIVGNALKKILELDINNKDKFNVVEGVLRNEPFTWNGKERSKNVITIFELKEYEEYEAKN